MPMTDELAAVPPEKREAFVKNFGLNPDGTAPELHEDLQEWMTETSFGWKALKHPLVYAIPYTEQMNGLYNAQYEHKQECLVRYTAEEQWAGFIMAHERPFRLEAFAAIMGRLNDQEYWELLAHVWTDSENIWQNADAWSILLTNPKRKYRPQHFMSEADRFALGHFAAEFEVWRGTSAPSGSIGSGLSWTIDKRRAEFFAKRFAQAEDRPAIVLHGKVKKMFVIAFLTDRGEAEIVVANPKHVTPLDTIYLDGGVKQKGEEDGDTDS